MKKEETGSREEKILFSRNPVSGAIECYTEDGRYTGTIETWPYQNLVRLYERRRKRFGMTGFESVNYYIRDRESDALIRDADSQWYRFDLKTLKWKKDAYLQRAMYPGGTAFDDWDRIGEEEAVDFILYHRARLLRKKRNAKRREQYWQKKAENEKHIR